MKSFDNSIVSTDDVQTMWHRIVGKVWGRSLCSSALLDVKFLFCISEIPATITQNSNWLFPVKVGFLYSATYMVDQEQRALTISEVAADWQEPVVLQHKCSHLLPMLTDIGPVVAASKHTTTPINHTRPSPRKHSSGGTTSTEIADTRLLLTTHLSTSKGWKAELA